MSATEQKSAAVRACESVLEWVWTAVLASVVVGITVTACVYTLKQFRGNDTVEQPVRTERRGRTTEDPSGVSQGKSIEGETRWWNGLLKGDDIEARERRSSDQNGDNSHEEWRPPGGVTGERKTAKRSELEVATLRVKEFAEGAIEIAWRVFAGMAKASGKRAQG